MSLQAHPGSLMRRSAQGCEVAVAGQGTLWQHADLVGLSVGQDRGDGRQIRSISPVTGICATATDALMSPSRGEDPARGWVVLGVPRESPAEDVLDGEVEATVAGAERPDARRPGFFGEVAVNGHATSFAAEMASQTQVRCPVLVTTRRHRGPGRGSATAAA